MEAYQSTRERCACALHSRHRFLDSTHPNVVCALAQILRTGAA